MSDSDDEKLLIYFDDEEHIIRRLGAAVVSCWDDLDEPLRQKLIARSKRVLDEHNAERLDEQIRTFIALHGRKRP